MQFEEAGLKLAGFDQVTKQILYNRIALLLPFDWVLLLRLTEVSNEKPGKLH